VVLLVCIVVALFAAYFVTLISKLVHYFSLKPKISAFCSRFRPSDATKINLLFVLYSKRIDRIGSTFSSSRRSCSHISWWPAIRRPRVAKRRLVRWRWNSAARGWRRTKSRSWWKLASKYRIMIANPFSPFPFRPVCGTSDPDNTDLGNSQSQISCREPLRNDQTRVLWGIVKLCSHSSLAMLSFLVRMTARYV